jgi:predicted XRE-type DNA-binding protein
MKKEKLIRSKGYNITKIQNQLFRELNQFMEENNMNRTQLAKHLGVTKGYVSQVLNGDFDYKLSKLVELSLAMGKIPQLKFVDITQVIKPEQKLDIVHHNKEYKLTNKVKENSGNFQFEGQDIPTYKIS